MLIAAVSFKRWASSVCAGRLHRACLCVRACARVSWSPDPPGRIQKQQSGQTPPCHTLSESKQRLKHLSQHPWKDGSSGVKQTRLMAFRGARGASDGGLNIIITLDSPPAHKWKVISEDAPSLLRTHAQAASTPLTHTQIHTSKKNVPLCLGRLSAVAPKQEFSREGKGRGSSVDQTVSSPHHKRTHTTPHPPHPPPPPNAFVCMCAPWSWLRTRNPCDGCFA